MDHGEEPDPSAAIVGGGAQMAHHGIGGGDEGPGGERGGKMEVALPLAVGARPHPGGDRDGDAGRWKVEGDGTLASEAHPQVPPPRARPRDGAWDGKERLWKCQMAAM